MTETASFAVAPVRHRDVTWEDPLIGAALAAKEPPARIELGHGDGC